MDAKLPLARMAPGDTYGAGRARAIWIEEDGEPVLLVALSASQRRRWVGRDEAVRAAGRRRWCPAARRALDEMVAAAADEARREVERLLGVPYARTLPVVISAGEVVHRFGGGVLARFPWRRQS